MLSARFRSVLKSYKSISLDKKIPASVHLQGFFFVLRKTVLEQTAMPVSQFLIRRDVILPDFDTKIFRKS